MDIKNHVHVHNVGGKKMHKTVRYYGIMEDNIIGDIIPVKARH